MYVGFVSLYCAAGIKPSELSVANGIKSGFDPRSLKVATRGCVPIAGPVMIWYVSAVHLACNGLKKSYPYGIVSRKIHMVAATTLFQYTTRREIDDAGCSDRDT